MTEAYVHESTYDEFDLGDETYGQCLLNSFDLEMVYLPEFEAHFCLEIPRERRRLNRPASSLLLFKYPKKGCLG